MKAILLHSVPEDERAVGSDGKRRPFGVRFPPTIDADGSPGKSNSSSRTLETGSFGRSSRRSRTRTQTPLAREEDWNLTATDDMWSAHLALAASGSESPARSASQAVAGSGNNSASAGGIAGAIGPAITKVNDPTEVLLAGFPTGLEYAAISKYERIAGSILEDFPRESQQQSASASYGSFSRRTLTAAEREKVNNVAVGECWVKVTFESLEAAERAWRASPVEINGFYVSAEPWRGSGLAAAEDKPVPAIDGRRSGPATPFGSRRAEPLREDAAVSTDIDHGFPLGSFNASRRSAPASSSNGTAQPLSSFSNSTSVGNVAAKNSEEQEKSSQPQFCSKIPSARRAVLLPADQIYEPHPSPLASLLSSLWLLNWMSGLLGGIGSPLPRKDDGTVEWEKAGWWWNFWWFIDWVTGSDWCGLKED